MEQSKNRRKNHAIEITELYPSEYETAVEWGREEGWKTADSDIEMYTKVDPDGLFAARINGEMVAVISAVNYGDEYAFVGSYITTPAYRGGGIGSQLFEHALRHTGKRTTGLYGEPSIAEKYGHYDFRTDTAGTVVNYYRMDLNNDSNSGIEDNIVDVKELSFEDLCSYDRKHFPASRTVFLKNWIAQSNGSALAYLKDGQICGFGVMRKIFGEQHFVAPLFADSVEIAVRLFENFCHIMGTGRILIGIPSDNENETRFADYFGIKPVAKSVRMYRNLVPINIQKNGVYGITTPDIG